MNNVYIGPRGSVCSAIQEIEGQREDGQDVVSVRISLHLGPGLSLGSAVYIHVISRLAEVPQEMIFQLSNHLLDTICTFLFSYSQVGLLGHAPCHSTRFLVEIPNH